MKIILGCFLVVCGMIAVAGSAGDCDGKYANSMGEMMIAIFIGLTLIVTGGIIIWKENS